MTEILVKLATNAVLVYGVALLCGGRIRFRGLAPVVSVAIFLVPVNVFVPHLNSLLGVPDNALWVFVSSVVCTAVILYALSYSIPKFTIDGFGVALAFSALMGAVALFLNYFLAAKLLSLL